jgi:S1-C subfamily serine protease
VALAAAALLGGGVALGGAFGVGAFAGTTTTVVEQAAASATGAAVPAATSGGLSVNEIYKRSGPGVVQITSTSGQGQALGSGFVIDKAGHIVTNYHVIEGANEIEVRFSNDDTLNATLVGSGPSTDLALLRADATARALTPLTLADSETVEVGDTVVAIGNPFGLERTVTSGIVSALQRAVTAPNGFAIDHVIQTDAPINHGNSGGPLLNARGEVIGVNSQIETGGSGDGNVGIGFAVPSNTVETVVAQLLSSGKVEHAYLGVAARELDPELARTFRLPVDTGLLVETVTDGSGAARAGLRPGTEQVVLAGQSYRVGGDVIVGADGTRVASIEDLRGVIAAYRPGEAIDVQIYRDGKQLTVAVTLGRQPTTPS